MLMSHLGTIDRHIRRFALDQANVIAEHLQTETVDYLFVARHARTLLQLAEEAQDSHFPFGS
jgi:hypothetical protein